MSDEVTTHQIQGFCDGVMMKGDWQEFHVNIGRQYPVKLSTKQDDIKAAALLAGTQVAVWTYTERQGGPNPHRPGEFFKNRYLSSVEVGGTLDPALAGQQSIPNAPTSGGVSSGGMPNPEGREVSIERQVIIKSTVGLYPAALIESDDDWFALLGRLDEWMAHPRPKAESTPADTAENAVATEPTAPGGGTDDDIPF